jgi:hypothetical protein
MNNEQLNDTDAPHSNSKNILSKVLTFRIYLIKYNRKMREGERTGGTI